MACGACKQRGILLRQAASNLRNGQIAVARGQVAQVGQSLRRDAASVLRSGKRVIFK